MLMEDRFYTVVRIDGDYAVLPPSGSRTAARRRTNFPSPARCCLPRRTRACGCGIRCWNTRSAAERSAGTGEQRRTDGNFGGDGIADSEEFPGITAGVR